MDFYLEMLHLDPKFPFQTLLNEGDILTTPHRHNEVEIIYVKQGVIHMGIGEESIEAGEGEFVLIAGGRAHYVLASPGSIRYVYQFHENFFYDLLQEKENRDSWRQLWRSYQAYSRVWEPGLAEEVKKLLNLIYEEDQRKQEGYTFAVKGYLSLIVLKLYRSKAYQKKANKENDKEGFVSESNYVLEKLDCIFRYVEENYQDQISLEEAADAIGFSTFYFTRFFKKNVGKTFLQFLNEYRIEKAKWLLINEELSVNEMIEQIGIGSTKTYYRLFKEIAGVSPSEYKRKNS